MEIIIYLPAKFEDNWRAERGEQGQAQQRGEHEHEDEVELLVGVVTLLAGPRRRARAGGLGRGGGRGAHCDVDNRGSHFLINVLSYVLRLEEGDIIKVCMKSQSKVNVF